MALIVHDKALQAAGGWQRLMRVIRRRDRALFEQIHRAMNSVVLRSSRGGGGVGIEGHTHRRKTQRPICVSPRVQADTALPDAFGGRLSRPTAPALSPKSARCLGSSRVASLFGSAPT